jgi:transcriptional regulator GlxA family with amidase domain
MRQSSSFWSRNDDRLAAACLPIYEENMTQNKVLRRFQGSPADQVDLLVLPGCSLMTLASAVEPLAGRKPAGRAHGFRLAVRVGDGAAPVTSSGIAWPVSGRHDDPARAATCACPSWPASARRK